ncbi:NUDIX hydrolase [Urechidicola croceus]|uniref:Coenzyme A pyrophosphatase n=1 Tax=Urechidicola croceus TaxID=1850246 RepID=A0A1D8P5U3_9FLAO|nr:CoA pyrophosphatase [Urechidicola croceus]AOW19916.1 coenzyme A pyrophosphatase [Urechidicola croceus]
MNFNEFLEHSKSIEKAFLGGLESQFKLAPKIRLKYSEEKIKLNNPKKASVLALFYPDLHQETRFLLTLRASYNGTHSAQVSFPGGKIEKLDPNLMHTAKRETFEEVGVKIEDIKILKQLTDAYIPPSNFLVTPFMGQLNYTPTFNINNEVEKTIEVKLSDLLNDSNEITKKITTSYMSNIEVPCFKFNDYIVWGATAMMLSEIKDVLKSL